MATTAKTAAPAGQPGLAGLSPQEGLTRLLSQQHRQLCDHYSQFIQQGGEEALHDLRVSLRRLRSLLRNYRNHIKCDKTLTDQLHALHSQTNPARDLEVFVAQLRRFCPQQLELISAVHQQLQQAYQQLQQELPPRWAELSPAIDASLSPAVTTDAVSLAQLTAELGKRQRKRLKKEFRSLRRHWDESRLHRLRIRAKRLRYLLEPLAEEACYPQTMTQMKGLQDTLGEYRDLQLLLQHIEGELIAPLQTQWRQQSQLAKSYATRRRQKVVLKSLRYALQQLQK